MPSHSPTPPPIPRPVVLAIVMQLVLTAVDVVSLAFVAFAVIGMTQSSQPPSDPTVDMVMRVSVIGYGIASMVGLSLGDRSLQSRDVGAHDGAGTRPHRHRVLFAMQLDGGGSCDRGVPAFGRSCVASRSIARPGGDFPLRLAAP